MKKVISIICLLTMVFSLFSVNAVFAENPKAEIEFKITEKDDIVEVDMIVKKAEFMGIQYALRYNKNVLVPVDKNGNEVDKFRGFAKKTEESAFFSTVGEVFEKEAGYFGITLYIMPGTESKYINEDGNCVVGESGLKLYTFLFKKTVDGDFGFEIATKDVVKPYQDTLPTGLLMARKGLEHLDANISYIYEDERLEQEIIYEKSEPVVKEETLVVKEEEKEDEKELTSIERKKDVICLKIGQSRTITFNKKKFIDDKNDKVVPYIVNDRTLVPLRFISETLGADVLWEDGWDGCIIKKAETEIKITFGSAEFEVNGEKFVYEAPIEVVEDRTMVPVRFVSEVLERDVYWDGANELVIISPKDNPWVETRRAEKTATEEMLISILGIL